MESTAVIAGPYRQRPGSGGFGVEVVTGVLHHKAKVQVSCEVQAELNLSDVGDVYRIRRI